MPVRSIETAWCHEHIGQRSRTFDEDIGAQWAALRCILLAVGISFMRRSRFRNRNSSVWTKAEFGPDLEMERDMLHPDSSGFSRKHRSQRILRKEPAWRSSDSSVRTAVKLWCRLISNRLTKSLRGISRCITQNKKLRSCPERFEHFWSHSHYFSEFNAKCGWMDGYDATRSIETMYCSPDVSHAHS
jgi:hypothetical protein